MSNEIKLHQEKRVTVSLTRSYSLQNYGGKQYESISPFFSISADIEEGQDEGSVRAALMQTLIAEINNFETKTLPTLVKTGNQTSTVFEKPKPVFGRSKFTKGD